MPGMAEQHDPHTEHHAYQPEREFFERARDRIDQALREVDEMEQRMAANIERERKLLHRARG